MNKKDKKAIEDALLENRVVLRREIKGRIDSALIIILDQKTDVNTTDYFSIRISDAIEAIMEHLGIRFKRVHSKYIIEKIKGENK